MQNDITPIKNELDALTKIIVETVPVEEIYLFGSYAYGTPRKDSDFDIYVVLKDDAPMRDLDAHCAIGMALYKKQPGPMDLLVRKKSKFLYYADSVSMIEKTVFKEGIKIYG
jgi:predicted nucleotidyltransferase